MTRGNQRDRDREKQRKKAASEKSANTLSGTEFQRKKEADAAKMREKQAKGKPIENPPRVPSRSMVKVFIDLFVFCPSEVTTGRCFGEEGLPWTAA
ncbi:hypothetical protein BJX61DRAFT_538749 [Aspergillus egyptiacus]|nr:hypothetical protein BJX61DRAFT_538749 [Aspergillus egyptiacus]